MKRPYTLPKPQQQCALCHSTKPLRLSHILPEFVFADIYDPKHRMIGFDPKNVDEFYYEQKGFRTYLLCDACERHLNDTFEKPFCRSWHQANVVDHFPAQHRAAVTKVDYVPFKLFHLSILWRAAVSRHPFFGRVSIGPHETTIRRMLLDCDPGQPWQYPIVCGLFTNDLKAGNSKQFIASPQPIKLYGHWGHSFTFGGCNWLYFTSSHQMPEIEHLRLQEDGTLPAGTIPLSKAMRIAIRTA